MKALHRHLAAYLEAAAAADKAGKRDVARRYYEKLVEIAKPGDGTRPAVGDARAFLDKPI